jgi:MFS family permease
MIQKYILYLSVLFAPLSGSAVITLIPTFSKSFNISLGTAGLVLTAYIIPFAVFQLFSGAIADAFSKKMSLVISLLIFGFLGFVIALAPSFEYVLLARFLMGIMGSFQIPVVIAIVGEIEEKNRGRAFGILTIFINLGLALGPLISGIIDVAISWQSFFLMVGVVSILDAILLYKTLDLQEQAKVHTFRQRSVLTLNNIKTAMSNSQVWIFSIAGFFAFTGLVSSYIFLPIYLLDLNYTQDIAGLIISVGGISAMIFGTYAGKTIDKFGRKLPLIAGFSLAFISYIIFGLVLQFIGIGQQIYFFFLILVIIGAGNAFAFSAMNTIANEIIEDLKATVASLSSSFRFIGFAVLPFLIPLYTEIGMMFFVALGIGFLFVGILLFLPLHTKKGQHILGSD